MSIGRQIFFRFIDDDTLGSQPIYLTVVSICFAFISSSSFMIGFMLTVGGVGEGEMIGPDIVLMIVRKYTLNVLLLMDTPLAYIPFSTC